MSSMAAQQGVVMLLAERLTSNLRVELPEEVVSKLNVAKRREALFSMLLEVETRRMLAVMEKRRSLGFCSKARPSPNGPTLTLPFAQAVTSTCWSPHAMWPIN